MACGFGNRARELSWVFINLYQTFDVKQEGESGAASLFAVFAGPTGPRPSAGPVGPDSDGKKVSCPASARFDTNTPFLLYSSDLLVSRLCYGCYEKSKKKPVDRHFRLVAAHNDPMWV